MKMGSESRTGEEALTAKDAKSAEKKERKKGDWRYVRQNLAFLLFVLILGGVLTTCRPSPGEVDMATVVFTATTAPTYTTIWSETVLNVTPTIPLPPTEIPASTPTKKPDTSTPNPTRRTPFNGYSEEARLYAGRDDYDYNTDSFIDFDGWPIGRNLYEQYGDLFEADVKFSVLFDSEAPTLLAVNGARIQIVNEQPTRSECVEQISNPDLTYHVLRIAEGDFLCALSNEGYLTVIHIESIEIEDWGGYIRMSYGRSGPPLVLTTPTPGPSDTFPIYVAENAGLIGSRDLDSEAQMIETERDIVLMGYISATHSYSVGAMNGAQLWSIGSSMPDYQNCQEVVLTLPPAEEAQISPDSYLCLLTNQGRLSQVYINELHPSLNGLVLMDYITWESLIGSVAAMPTPVWVSSVPIRQSGVARLFIAKPDDAYEYNYFPSSTRPQSYVDLDDGMFQNIEEGDLQFVGDHGSGSMAVYTAWLRPVNEAAMWKMEDGLPSFKECQAMLRTPPNSSSDMYGDGDYYCILTNEGRLSQIRIDGFDYSNLRGKEAWIQITYVTWDEVVVPAE
jgi:hypothetical protein